METNVASEIEASAGDSSRARAPSWPWPVLALIGFAALHLIAGFSMWIVRSYFAGFILLLVPFGLALRTFVSGPAPPRERKLRLLTPLQGIVLALWLVAGYFAMDGHAVIRLRRELTTWQETIGTITNVATEKDTEGGVGNSHFAWELAYQYEVSGIAFAGDASIGDASTNLPGLRDRRSEENLEKEDRLGRYWQFDVGDELSVLYDPVHPERSYAKDQKRDVPWLELLLTLALMPLVAWLFLGDRPQRFFDSFERRRGPAERSPNLRE